MVMYNGLQSMVYIWRKRLKCKCEFKNMCTESKWPPPHNVRLEIIICVQRCAAYTALYFITYCRMYTHKSVQNRGTSYWSFNVLSDAEWPFVIFAHFSHSPSLILTIWSLSLFFFFFSSLCALSLFCIHTHHILTYFQLRSL